MSFAMKRAILALSAISLAFTLAGCGGGNGIYQSLALTPTIAVSPPTANVQAGASQQFVANVTNSLEDTVTWEVNGVIGGNTQVGTIDINGLYTAPALIPTPPNLTVTAILNAATNYSANSILTITTATFNSSSLQGNYILSLRGLAADGSPFYALGAVSADGNGNITGGEEDLNDANSGYSHATPVTGSYTVGPDGRGTLNLNSSLGSFSYAIALRASNSAGLNEMDKNVYNATGSLEGQANGVTAPSGNYAFGFTGTSALCGALNANGILGWNSGAMSGLQDVNCAGTVTQNQSLSGSYANPDAMGRGTGSFAANTGASDFVYYVVSADRYRFLCSDSSSPFLGSTGLQTQSSFAASDFNGNYIVASTASSTGAFAGSLALISAAGGNIPGGYMDINSTGTFNSYNLTGAYSLSTNGYVNGTLNTLAGAFPFSMYLVSPTQAYYLDLRTDLSGGGTVEAQNMTLVTEGNFAYAGSYATEQFGYYVASGVISTGNSTTVGGQISSNGSGGLSGTLDINDPSGLFPGLPLQGSYSMGSAVLGRGTAKLTTSDGTRNYVIYVVDQTRVEMLETDTSITASGDSILQF
jgi:hypothetical protein